MPRPFRASSACLGTLASTKEFSEPLHIWTTYRLRPGVEEDHRQENCFWDMTHFRSIAFSLVANQILFVELAYSLTQIFLRKVGRNELIDKSRQRLLDSLAASDPAGRCASEVAR